MPLENLLELIEILRNRIDEHGASLRQSEALTRYALIDPLLRELGWDTEDPSLVMPEYRLGPGFADYALIIDRKPSIVVEAKPLGASLKDAASQGITYCITDGIRYFSVTDGSHWEIYETHRPVPIHEKRIVSFNLKVDAPAKACLQALALWQPSVGVGRIDLAQAPLIETTEENARSTAGVRSSTYPPPSGLDKSWIPLSSFQPEAGTQSTVEIHFPDGKTAKLAQWQWYRVTTEIVGWLYEKGKFPVDNSRVQRGSRYIVSDSPTHPNGKQFTAQKDVGPLFVEANYSSSYLVRNAQMIIEHVGMNASQFHIRSIT